MSRSRRIDMTGWRMDEHGVPGSRLTVIEVDPSSRKSGLKWICKCDCGSTGVSVRGTDLRSGHTTSCGCYAKERQNAAVKTHGMTHDRLYGIWASMKQRCSNPKTINYHLYGGSSIKVCDEWKDFTAFAQWAYENGYQPDLTIDRIDNSLGYSPSNCHWVNCKVQANNRRNNHVLTYNGRSATLSEWSTIVGIYRETIYHRLLRGWSVEDALEKPVKSHTKRSDNGE